MASASAVSINEEATTGGGGNTSAKPSTLVNGGSAGGGGVGKMSAGAAGGAMNNNQEEARAVPISVEPPDGGFGWVVVFASFMCNLTVDGIAYTFGLFLPELVSSFNSTKSAITWAGSLLGGCYLSMGPIVSALTNKFGCRKVCIAGSLVACGAFCVTTMVTSVPFLLLFYGVLGGTGFSLIYLPAIISVNQYFSQRRATATGIAVCGSGLGAFVFAPLVQHLLEVFAWRGALLILCGFILNCCVFGALMRPLELVAPVECLEKPLMQRIWEEKTGLLNRQDSITQSQFFLVQHPDGTVEKRLKAGVNTEPGVHSTLYLDQWGKSACDGAPALGLSPIEEFIPGKTISSANGVLPVSNPAAHMLHLKRKGLIASHSAARLTLSSTSSQPVVQAEILQRNFSTPKFAMGASRSSITTHNHPPSAHRPLPCGTPANHLSHQQQQLAAGSHGPVSSAIAPVGAQPAHHLAPAASLIAASNCNNNEPAGATSAAAYLSNATATSNSDAAQRQLHHFAPHASSVPPVEPATSGVAGSNVTVATTVVLNSQMRRSIRDLGRPMYRKDIFYSGSIRNLPEFQQSSGDVRSYMASVLTLPGENAPNATVATACGCLPPAMRDTLGDIFDPVLIKNPAFIIICLSNLIGMMGFNIPFVFISDAAVTISGVTKETASLLVSCIGITNMFGRLLFGRISDSPRVNSLVVNNVTLVLSGLAVALTPTSLLLGGYSACMVVSGFFGLMVAAYVLLTSIILVDLFGLEHLTNAFGLLCLVRGCACILGTPFAGILYDLTGSYQCPFIVSGIMLAASGITAAAIPYVSNPHKTVAHHVEDFMSPLEEIPEEDSFEDEEDDISMHRRRIPTLEGTSLAEHEQVAAASFAEGDDQLGGIGEGADGDDDDEEEDKPMTFSARPLSDGEACSPPPAAPSSEEQVSSFKLAGQQADADPVVRNEPETNVTK